MARESKKAAEKEEPASDVVNKLVAVNRVAKVVKGGKRFGFAALVVVGDGKGKVGYGTGKAKEVTDAVKKATDDAKKHMVRIALREGRTLHHDIAGRFGAGRIYMRSAPPGTGIIAGGPMRAVFEALGVQDVVAKSIGTSNPHGNVVGRPNNSTLNQFPQRPIACATTTPGASASAKTPNVREFAALILFLLKLHQAAANPSEIAPQIPSPPCQI